MACKTKKALQCPQILLLAEGGVWGRDKVTICHDIVTPGQIVCHKKSSKSDKVSIFWC